jgi:hypothetical protein
VRGLELNGGEKKWSCSSFNSSKVQGSKGWRELCVVVGYLGYFFFRR